MTSVRSPIPTPLDGETRFAFGQNWHRFLAVLGEERIREAELSLCQMLGRDSLRGLSFLDVGSGSGLFSLAAYRLGAERVHSLDVDPASVGCTQELRSRYGAKVASWTIEQASVLDREHIQTLGYFDVVYSWGVLHHTGDMWAALDNVTLPVAAGGTLFIAIYNDGGIRTDLWRAVKRFYNRLPPAARAPYVAAVWTPFEMRSAIRGPRRYIRTWREYKRRRGMSRWHDMVDWVGGYPFEVASPEAIFDFYRDRGFTLTRLLTDPRQNEFVFTAAG
jgi:2-polyprenyl-6-hydroxyphenyl methylase/3-demethylubiquinone-9 3-methyltransferase